MLNSLTSFLTTRSDAAIVSLAHEWETQLSFQCDILQPTLLLQHLEYVKYEAQKCEVERSWTCYRLQVPVKMNGDNNRLPERHQQRETLRNSVQRTPSLCASLTLMHECVSKPSQLPTLTAFSATNLSDGMWKPRNLPTKTSQSYFCLVFHYKRHLL